MLPSPHGAGRKGIRPVKKLEWWGAGVVICLERGADLHMAQLMPLQLTVSFFSKTQTGFTFLVPAHPGNPGKRTVKRVCVCSIVYALSPMQKCILYLVSWKSIYNFWAITLRDTMTEKLNWSHCTGASSRKQLNSDSHQHTGLSSKTKQCIEMWTEAMIRNISHC